MCLKLLKLLLVLLAIIIMIAFRRSGEVLWFFLGLFAHGLIFANQPCTSPNNQQLF